MKKIVLLLLLSFFTVAFGYEVIIPNNKSYIKQDVPRKCQKFIAFMVPKIDTVNQEILILRKNLIYLHFIWHTGTSLTNRQKAWVTKLARDYHVSDIDFSQNKTWNILLKRVDGLPNSLVLAQAITKSGWGTSRFARHGNNYFGQWCNKPACGIVPKRRPKGATYEVKKYATAIDSVKGYILNINVFSSYRKLRNLRSELRSKREKLTGIVLAQGLSHYSQKGKRYIENLKSIIKKYDLEQLDKHMTNI
jgi:Bax protein